MRLQKRIVSALLASWTIVTITMTACGSSAQPTAPVAPAPATAATPQTALTATPAARMTMTNAAGSATAVAEPAVERPAGWTEASHGNQAEPDYAVVFPQAKVNQITITIAPEDWAAMQANMTELLGAQGAGSRGGVPADRQPLEGGMQPPGDGMQPPPGAMQPPGDGMQPPGRGGFPGGGRGAEAAPGGMRGNLDLTPTNPMWVEATITLNGETWTHVGVRYKGNSTLIRAWQQGSAQLPLKLDFDQFEDAYPEIKNQRFYGFKQLSLANNLGDPSYLHDAISYDIMEAAGLVTPETAFYEVILDCGEGPVSLGVYTAVEVVDDTVIERYFDDADGNIYEADGPAASFAAGTAEQIPTSFQKENNEEAADWSDLQAVYDALHSTRRTTEPAVWRTGLEAVFDVDAFLEWLAVSALIQDWDTYGTMSHNYYLYHDPATDQLVWISWDHNEAFFSGGRGDTSLDRASVGENWPLIRYLLDDPVYHARYSEFLRTALTDAFDADELAVKIDTMAALIHPYIEKAGNGQGFDAAVAQLKTFTAGRVSAVEAFLAE